MKQLDLQPTFRAPPKSCDAHFHVFGDPAKFPHRDPKLRYAPPFAPLESYLETADKLGIERFVVVQPSAYGRDNSCVEDALRQLGIERARGIVDVDDDCPESEFARLHALGARGVRINVSPVHPYEEGLAEKLIARVDRLESNMVKFGWQFDFLGPGWLTEKLIPRMSTLKVDYTLAHMGMFLAAEGPDQPGFLKLLDLLNSGDRRCWIKLTAVYRMSKTDGYVDAAPMVERLLEVAPDRLIWGSDDPHASFGDKVGSVELFNLFGEWVPDDATRKQILVDNPAKLFGF